VAADGALANCGPCRPRCCVGLTGKRELQRPAEPGSEASKNGARLRRPVGPVVVVVLLGSGVGAESRPVPTNAATWLGSPGADSSPPERELARTKDQAGCSGDRGLRPRRGTSAAEGGLWRGVGVEGVNVQAAWRCLEGVRGTPGRPPKTPVPVLEGAAQPGVWAASIGKQNKIEGGGTRHRASKDDPGR